MQALRLGLPRRERQTTLRMTAMFVTDLRDQTLMRAFQGVHSGLAHYGFSAAENWVQGPAGMSLSTPFRYAYSGWARRNGAA
jgi:hypothetical protein